MNAILKQEAGWYNPYNLNGKEIYRIYFFDEKGVVCSTRWFGNNNKYPEWGLPVNVVNKRKKDFSLSKGFLIREINELRGKKVYNLYLPINKFSYNDKKVVEKTDFKIINKIEYLIEIRAIKTGSELFEYYRETVSEVISVDYTDLYKQNERISERIKKECNIDVHPFSVERLKNIFKDA